MADLLLELQSEEIPARMQEAAREQLRRAVEMRLDAADLAYGDVRSYATPRRLALAVTGLPDEAPALREERRGPRVDAPEAAVQGFLRSTGLTREALDVREEKRGRFYFAVTERPSRPIADVVADIVPEVIRTFDWPKSMCWGAGTLKWVRPLHGIVCIVNGKVAPVEIDGLKSGNATRGHRFAAPDTITVKNVADWEKKLKNAFVLVDTDARKRRIMEQAHALVKAGGYDLVEDQRLLNEIAGLVEWPVVLMGAIDEGYMSLPREVLVSVMGTHQKYMAVRNPATGELAPCFIAVANLETPDGGAAVIRGNERVLRARLEDARFAFDCDREGSPGDLTARLKTLDFYPGLGSMHDKAGRMAVLARGLVGLAQMSDVTPEEAAMAAMHAKLDLVSTMVEEFPGLQGVMGRILAPGWECSEQVAIAIGEHYRPLGPGDAIPGTPLGRVLALADKLDNLFEFQRINEMPTGSGDPNGLRRAALGVIRIILEGNLDKITLRGLDAHCDKEVEGRLLSFIHGRLKVYLRGQGVRHDVIDAVFALAGQDTIVTLVRRIGVLSDFLKTQDGANLLAGYRRAVNILTIEEKKDNTHYDGAPDASLFTERAERALATRAEKVASDIRMNKGLQEGFGELAKLRAPVDDFFDKVMVNVPESEVRANRLRLLAQVRSILNRVADFSRLEASP